MSTHLELPLTIHPSIFLYRLSFEGQTVIPSEKTQALYGLKYKCKEGDFKTSTTRSAVALRGLELPIPDAGRL